MLKILIVDDEPDIRNLIREYAQNAGYNTFEAGSGPEALELCQSETFDCIIADVMMPKMDGLTMTAKIKEICDTPILMLSAKGEEYDKLFGFNAGVDDYVVKPFSPRELLARIKVIISRHKKEEETSQVLQSGKIRIDIGGREVYIDGIRRNFTTKGFDLLLYLMKNRSIVLTRDQILDNVWGDDFFGDDRLVDAQIKLLRSQLGDCRDYVKTVRGIGYK